MILGGAGSLGTGTLRAPLQIHARGSRRYALDDRSMFRFSAEKRDFLSFHGSESANPLILHTLAAAAASDLYIISYSSDATRARAREYGRDAAGIHKVFDREQRGLHELEI